ncbi:MAG: hypothetical protein JNJ83_07125 [Verrucomicrobiaceae bacterium]|nr:hypothetical protein [Verrucomicrobiaceae bacterium]
MIWLAVTVPGLLTSRGVVQQMWNKLGFPGAVEKPLKDRVATATADPKVKAEVLRKLAQEAFEVDPSLARLCYHKLERVGASSEVDRCGHSILLAKLHDFTGARAVLGGKPGKLETLTAPVREAWVRLWSASGDFVSAAGALEATYECGEKEALLAIETAEMAHSEKAPVDVCSRLDLRAVYFVQAALLAGAESSIKPLIDRILALPLAGEKERFEAAAMIRRLNQPGVAHRLALVRLSHPTSLFGKVRLDYENATREALAMLGALTVTEKAAALSYLLTQREYKLALEVVPLLESRTDRTLFLQRVQAALAMGDWREAGRMASNASAPRVPWARSLLHATSALQEPGNNGLMAESLVNAAVSESALEKRWESAFAVGKMALDHRLRGLATRAFELVLNLAPDRVEALDRLSAVAKGYSDGLLVVRLAAREALRDERDDEAIASKAYLEILAGLRPEMPSGDGPMSTLVQAFAAYTKNDVTAAVQKIMRLPRQSWSQGKAAVIATILAAGGQRVAAEPLMAAVDLDNLFPEEAQLIQPWIAVSQGDRSSLSMGGSAGKLLGQP